MGTVTRIGTAKKGTKSLKSTIPESIVEFLKLKDKDEVEWNMETQNDDRVVVIKKK
jgi:antitoxin component of MazEF toxin-antitoxin module